MSAERIPAIASVYASGMASFVALAATEGARGRTLAEVSADPATWHVGCCDPCEIARIAGRPDPWSEEALEAAARVALASLRYAMAWAGQSLHDNRRTARTRENLILGLMNEYISNWADD